MAKYKSSLLFVFFSLRFNIYLLSIDKPCDAKHYAGFFKGGRRHPRYMQLYSKYDSKAFYGFHVCRSVAEIILFWALIGDDAVPLTS